MLIRFRCKRDLGRIPQKTDVTRIKNATRIARHTVAYNILFLIRKRRRYGLLADEIRTVGIFN